MTCSSNVQLVGNKTYALVQEVKFSPRRTCFKLVQLVNGDVEAPYSVNSFIDGRLMISKDVHPQKRLFHGVRITAEEDDRQMKIVSYIEYTRGDSVSVRVDCQLVSIAFIYKQAIHAKSIKRGKKR